MIPEGVIVRIKAKPSIYGFVTKQMPNGEYQFNVYSATGSSVYVKYRFADELVLAPELQPEEDEA